MDFGTAFNGIAAIGSIAAIIMSLWLTNRVASQTERISQNAQTLAAEGHLHSRFDAIFEAIDKLLEALSDLKADAYSHRAALKNTSTQLSSPNTFDAVQRSMEHLHTRFRFLDTILVGLPIVTTDEAAIARLTAATGRFDSAKDWLGAASKFYYYVVKEGYPLAAALTREEAEQRCFEAIQITANQDPATAVPEIYLDNVRLTFAGALPPTGPIDPVEIALRHLDVALDLFVDELTRVAWEYRSTGSERFSPPPKRRLLRKLRSSNRAALVSTIKTPSS